MHTQVPDQERQRETCEDTMCFVICVEMAEDAKRSKLDALGSWQRYGLQICKNFATSEPSVKLYHPTFRNLAC